MITSGGGLTTLETARKFPIRLVESGPAGGAILAAALARQCGLDKVLSFDMGGTTAKICLIDDGEPQHSRTFEVARQYRFLKGSGLPLRIPVIEMVEIGAGGGSIAHVDSLKPHQCRPRERGLRAGSRLLRPRRHGAHGHRRRRRAGPHRSRPLRRRFDQARRRRRRAPRRRGGRHAARARAHHAAFGVSEVVEENMANAARVHAVERGKELQDRTMIAFGGAAPLHAARLAEKLGITA
jgi:N-methylhydantoinase A